MERFYNIAPELIPAAFMLSTFAYYCIRRALGRQPEVEGLNRRKFTEIIGPVFTGYFIWLLSPVEQRFRRAGISPNVITCMSLTVCAGAGLAVATGYLSVAAWAYILAGALDILDGRLARATNRSSRAGAFLDSVSDRWAELFVFAGLAWYMRESTWLLAVMLGVAGSMMVSYTRARGEGLDVVLDGGTMQRAERILVTSVGLIFAAWYNAWTLDSGYGIHIAGSAILLVGIGATSTGLYRWWKGYQQLKKLDGQRAADDLVLPKTKAGKLAHQVDKSAA